MARFPWLSIKLEGSGCSFERNPWPEGVWGPVDLSFRRLGPTATVLGAGPLGTNEVPLSNRLVICGTSPCWEGFHLSSVGGVGHRLFNLGLGAVSVSGRASVPSVGVVSPDGVRLEPVDLDLGLDSDPEADSAWWDQGAAGVVAEAAALASGPAAALVCGPASALTSIGALGVAELPADPSSGRPRIRSWAGRGGFGSRFFGIHNLVGLVIEAPAQFTPPPPDRAGPASEVHPLLSEIGTLGVNLMVQAHHIPGFNGSTIDDPDSLSRVERLVVDHYLPQYRNDVGRLKSRSCGQDCTAACRKELAGRKKDYQPFVALGPHIGVFQQSEAQRVVDVVDRLGLDAVDAGGWVAWLMELVWAGDLSPSDLGIPRPPHFDVRDFEAESHSHTNADVACSLLLRLGGPGSHAAARVTLRHAAREMGGAAREKAVYLANGDSGAVCPLHYWAPGAFAQVGLAGRYHTDLSGQVTEPRALGRRCAERMVAELTYDNLGLCRFQEEWNPRRLAEMLGHTGPVSEDELIEHHRRLAKEIQSASRPVFWETERVRRLVQASARDHRPRYTAELEQYWNRLGQSIEDGLSSLS